MKLTVYLSGEIHTSWRDDVETSCLQKGLDITFLAPVTDHAASDDCGVHILGGETDKFWHDHKGAKLNAIRTRTAIGRSDVVVVKKHLAGWLLYAAEQRHRCRTAVTDFIVPEV